MNKDLYKFTEVRNNTYGGSFCFTFMMDCSSYMDVEVLDGRTRFEVMIEQVRHLTHSITQLKSLHRFDCTIGFVGYGNSATSYSEQFYNAENLADAIDFLDGLGIRTGGPDFDFPMTFCHNVNNGENAGYTNLAFFISGDDADPTSSASDAATTFTDLINSTGYYATQPVKIYGYNVDNTDTQYTAQVVNQGTTVIDSSIENSLFEPINNIILGEVNDFVSVDTFTSADSNETYDSLTYTTKTMGRGYVELDGELSKNKLKVSFAVDDTFASPWLQRKGTFLNLELLEIDDDDEVTKTWKGRLVSVEASGKKILLVFESAFTMLRRWGLNRIYQRSCAHSLFDRGCKVQKSDYDVDGTITSISGDALVILEATPYEPQYFTFGTIEDENGEIVSVTYHLGTVVKVSFIPQSWVDSGTPITVKMYPGCTKGAAICISRFDNILNYGGFPHMPPENKFDKTVII